MKIAWMAVALLTMPAIADAQSGHYVRGYTRSNGTYVAPHYQTNPDSSRTNNWSSQGNVNPYTGQTGTVNPYAPRPLSSYGSSYRAPVNPYATDASDADPE